MTRFRSKTSRINGRFRRINRRFRRTNGRFGKINGRFGRINGRFGRINRRFRRINRRFGRINRRFRLTNRRFRTAFLSPGATQRSGSAASPSKPYQCRYTVARRAQTGKMEKRSAPIPRSAAADQPFAEETDAEKNHKRNEGVVDDRTRAPFWGNLFAW